MNAHGATDPLHQDKVEPLNYCAHAIEDLRRFEATLPDTAPMSALAVRRLIDLLRNSVKFILPNCCDLLDPNDMRQAHLDLMRLPFPSVAFEAPWIKDAPGPEYIGDFQQTPATKRIALCWEARAEYELLPGLNRCLDLFPGGGVFVVPIFWIPANKRWSLTLGGTFVPYENEFVTATDNGNLPASRLAHAALKDSGQVKPGANQMRSEPFHLLPEIFDAAVSAEGDLDKTVARIILDCHDETSMLIQACSVINCANVSTDEIAPPAALNKKRQANGKQPFFSYKVLQLAQERPAAGGSAVGGHHASPRMHLRRGHLRRLDTKTVWVRPAMISANSPRGAVHKDYAVGH